MTDSRGSRYSYDSKKNKKNYLFDPDSKKYYKKGKKLGGGGFGEVFELIDSETGEIRAVKVISLKKLENPQSNEAYLNEYKFNNSLNYKYICKCYNTFKDNDNAYFILEYQPNKTLNELIGNRYSLFEIEVKHYCYELLLAIEYLHNRNIIHRDIKLSNVLLSEKMEVKLCDFGLAIGNNSVANKTICGTPNYIAPEILNYKNGTNYSFEIDIWSFGIILYSLFYKKTPFESPEKGKTKKNIQNVIYKFPENNQVSDDAKDLMRSIFVKEPSLRPTIKEIKESNFFNNGIGIPKYLPPSSQYMRLSMDYLQNFVNEAIANNECLDTENETTKNYINSPNLKYKNSIDNYNESDSEQVSNNSNSSEFENDEESQKENKINNNEVEKKSEKNKRKSRGRNLSVKLERIEQKYTFQNDNFTLKHMSNKNNRNKFHENEIKSIGENIPKNKNDNNDNKINNLNNIHENNFKKDSDNDNDNDKDKEDLFQSKEEIYYKESAKFNNIHDFRKLLNDTIESEINKINIKSCKDVIQNQRNVSKDENTETVLSDTLNYSKNTLNNSNLFLSSKKIRFRNSSNDFLFKQFYHKSIFKKKMFNVIPQRTNVDDIVVKKYIDISNKCGIGYFLTNGDIGAYFNDGTKLVIIKDSFNIIYIESKGNKKKIFLDDNYINDNDLQKKIKVLSLFFKKFNKNKINEININQLYDKQEPDVYVTKWTKTSKASFFLLSNKEIQCIFNDKTQVIFNMKNKTVLFINHLKKLFKEDMRLDDFSSYEMTVRVLYAKKVLIKL